MKGTITVPTVRPLVLLMYSQLVFIIRNRHLISIMKPRVTVVLYPLALDLGTR